MPDPCSYRDEADFHADCVAARQRESDGEEPIDQSNAVCYQMWRDRECPSKGKSMSDSSARRIEKSGYSIKGLVGNSDLWLARFVASSPAVDRAGDIVELDWDFVDFKKNPVLAFAHETGRLPVGRVPRIEVDRSMRQVIADTEKVPEGVDEFADKVAAFVKLGYLNAVSVGFTSRKPEPRFDKDGEWIGMRYSKNSLHELSIVPVPANQEALAIARGLQCSPGEMCKMFSRHAKATDYMPHTDPRQARALIERMRAKYHL